MNWSGIILGAASFMLIGIFHPIVVKAEYYFGKESWWAFALAGAGFLTVSLFIANTIFSAILGVAGFSCFWSILELFEQEKRVQRGWFPANPKRKRK